MIIHLQEHIITQTESKNNSTELPCVRSACGKAFELGVQVFLWSTPENLPKQRVHPEENGKRDFNVSKRLLSEYDDKMCASQLMTRLPSDDSSASETNEEVDAMFSLPRVTTSATEQWQQ